jgi:hypothetical protein
MKLLKILLLAACSTMANVEKTEACSCAPYGSIFWTFNQYRQNNYLGSTNIVMGQITSTIDGYGITLKILGKYFTTESLPDTIKIWGDPGTTCRGNPTGYGQYKIGDTVIDMLEPLSFGVQGPDESINDFSLPCGFSSILIRNDSAIGGSFNYSPLAMPLSQFVDSMNSILTAPVVSVPAITKAQETNFIYPNPAQLDFNLTSSDLQATDLLHIFDLNGRLMQSEEVQFQDGEAKVHTNLIPGIYAVQLIEPTGNVRTQKLIINR